MNGWRRREYVDGLTAALRREIDHQQHATAGRLDELHARVSREADVLETGIRHRHATMQAQVDCRFDGHQQEMDRRFADLKEQTGLSRENLERRLGELNNFRLALADQQAHYVSREVLDQILKGLEQARTLAMASADQRTDKISDRIDKIEDWRNTFAGSQQGTRDYRAEARLDRTAGLTQAQTLIMVISPLVAVAALITTIILHH